MILTAFMAVTLIILASPGAQAKKQPAGAVAAITLDEKTHNFGTISEQGGAVTHSFRFTNTGTAPLVIISATASCGCTRPTYPQKPIAPGKSGVIKVTYLPQGRPGVFDKKIKVRTSDPRQRKLTLTITGTVVP